MSGTDAVIGQAAIADIATAAGDARAIANPEFQERPLTDRIGHRRAQSSDKQHKAAQKDRSCFHDMSA
jgi:hypothetical protein